MWKLSNAPSAPALSPEPGRPAYTPTINNASHEVTYAAPRASAPIPSKLDQATIGKSFVIKGEVVGSESLYIDGRIEGSINLPGNLVTVGRNGVVSANITARDIVVLGKVRGNINAGDRFDIGNEGSLTGDVVAQHISIEDGAFFKGGIDIRKPTQKTDTKTEDGGDAPTHKPPLARNAVDAQ
jgi:cytoskeletal protein CcmA (bactofilin family)